MINLEILPSVRENSARVIKNRIDLTGRVFGELIVKSRNYEKSISNKDKGHSYWNCEDKYENKCIIRGDHLLSGKIDKFKTPPKIVKIGDVFGDLIVISKNKENPKRCTYNCQHKNGKIAKFTANELTTAKFLNSIRYANILDISGATYENIKVIDINCEDSKNKEDIYWNCEDNKGRKWALTAHSIIHGNLAKVSLRSEMETQTLYPNPVEGDYCNNLEIISYHGLIDGFHYWNCRCKCGSIKLIRKDRLVKKEVISCGCYQIEKASTRNGITRKIKSGEITKAEYIQILNKEKPSRKFRSNISNQIRSTLNGTKNYKKIFDYLPYSFKELVSRIESQFNSDMSWSNYGSYWSIDHIIPQSYYDFESMKSPLFLRCWNLDNLRPLECVLNSEKNDLILSEFEYLIKVFEDRYPDSLVNIGSVVAKG